MTNTIPRGMCKKHNVGKLEYAIGRIGSDKTGYKCPVCLLIKQLKHGIKEQKEKLRVEIKQFKREIIKAKEYRQERINQIQEQLNNIKPEEIFKRNIEHRTEFNKEHNQLGE